MAVFRMIVVPALCSARALGVPDFPIIVRYVCWRSMVAITEGGRSRCSLFYRPVDAFG
jgi:hypothetical protein